VPYTTVEPIIGAPIDAYPATPTVQGGHDIFMDVRLYAGLIAARALAEHRGVAVTAENLAIPSVAESVLTRPPTQTETQAVQQSLGPDWTRVGRYVSMANHLAAAIELKQQAVHEDPAIQARATVQHGMVVHTLTNLQRVRLPRHQTLHTPIKTALRTGTVAVAPPGAGKTAVGAEIIRDARCTERLFAGDTHALGALVAVPSVELVDQYSSTDPDNIFREIVGWDVPVHTYWARNKELGAVTVITYRSLQEAVDKGLIKAGDFGITFLDEVHFALGPKTLEAVSKICSGVVGATATPAYSIDKDIRRLFPHIEAGSVRDFVEQGILNRARLFTYLYEDNNEAEDIAVKLALQWIQEGRQTIIFAQAGKHSLQARKIAMMINGQLDEEKAGAAGSFSGNRSAQNLAAFKKGDLQVLVTTKMFQQGVNARANGVMTIGASTSMTDLVQRAGRGLRLNPLETHLAEIMPHKHLGRINMASLWSMFGVTDFQQGYLVGSEAGGLFEDKPQLEKLVPEELQKSLASPVAIRSMLVGPEDLRMSEQPPEDYLSVADLALLYGSHEKYVRKVLDGALVPSMDIWVAQGKEKITERWYSPEAITYLDEHPPLKIIEGRGMVMSELAILTGLSRTFLQRLVERHGISHTPALMRGRAQVVHAYDDEATARILELVEAIPFAGLEDVPIGSFTEELGESFPKTYAKAHNIVFTEMRRHPAHGLKGITQHVTAADAQRIRDGYRRATDSSDYMSLGDIAEAAGVDLSLVSTSLTEEERASLQSFSRKGEKKMSSKGKYLSKQAAQEVIKRLTPQPLPAHLVPRAALLGRHRNIPKSTFKRVVDRLGIPVVDVQVRAGQPTVPCISWESIRTFEVVHKPTQGVFKLEHDRLPTEDETDETKIMYGRLVQAHLRLVPRNMWAAVSDVAGVLHASEPAILALLRSHVPTGGKMPIRSIEGVRQAHLASLGSLLGIVSHVRPMPQSGWVSRSTVLEYYASAQDRIDTYVAKHGGTISVFKKDDLIDICYSVDTFNAIRQALGLKHYAI